jgi:hypothetical protein
MSCSPAFPGIIPMIGGQAFLTRMHKSVFVQVDPFKEVPIYGNT